MTDAAIASCGGKLLDDEAVTVATRAGPVQVIGLRYRHRGAAARHAQAFFAGLLAPPADAAASAAPGDGGAALPTTPAVVGRFVLLHDPSAFIHVPPMGAVVLSGHTHGGHVGLFSLGLRHATVGRLVGLFDNGAWLPDGPPAPWPLRRAFGDVSADAVGNPAVWRNLLYVHRGQGHRSLMANAVFRLGVPSEDSVFRVRLWR